MDKKEYRKSSHTVHDIRIHLVWITKYRYKVINNDIAKRLIEIIRTICSNQNIQIISGTVNNDHLHLYMSLPPTLSVSKTAQLIKGISSNKIMKDFPDLQKRYYGRHFWARGYFVSTIGNIDHETIQNYIKNHNSEDISDDTFTISVR
jgi:putative transposase